MIVAAMAAYPLVTFSDFKSSDVAVLLSVIAAYGLAIILFFGIPTLVFMERWLLVRVACSGALLIGLAVASDGDSLHVVLGWGMIYLTALVCGWMTKRGLSSLVTYSVGLALIVVIALIEFGPQWQEMMQSLAVTGGAYVKDVATTMNLSGSNELAVARNSERLQQVVDLVVRLLPASTILSPILQFSVGFLWFSGLTVRGATGESGVRPFTEWRAPFVLTVLLVGAMAARLLGGETFKLAADNVLVVLLLLYAVTGFALVENTMRKMGLPRGMKIIGYVLIFLLQFAGFLLTALLGFVDSFVDWRGRAAAKNAMDN